MSSHHELRERADLLSELGQIVQAMKNVAFAELQRVSRARPALDEASTSVLHALESLRAEAGPLHPTPAVGTTVWLAIGADRGFCGAFNARLAAAVKALRREDPHARVLVAGRALAGLLEALTPKIVPIAGCSSVEEAYPALENWIAGIDRAAAGAREVHMLPSPEPVRKPGERRMQAPPSHHLPLPVLRSALLRQAVRLLLQTGLSQSLEQENRARLAQMQRAQDHLDELGRKLRRRYAVLRQTEITDELEMLMTSVS